MLVIDADVDELVPNLADFFQRALNATNSIASESTEFMVMGSMAEFAGQHATQKPKEQADWAKVQEAACAGEPRSAPYAHLLSDYARLLQRRPWLPNHQGAGYVFKATFPE